MNKILLIIATVFLLSSCANIVPPTGGPRDKTPPQVDLNNSLPSPDQLTNYHSDYILLKFDEDIQVVNYQNEIYTTPYLDPNKFKVETKKKTLKLYFKQALDTNTTYTFHFGNSIKDITENNIAQDIQLAFSTGSIIDTLSIRGICRNHLTKKPQQNILVALYDTEDTNTVYSGKPKYYTKSKVNGSFSLDYIKSGTYELIAINDENNDFHYSINKELIGFSDSLIQLSTPISKVQIDLIKEPDTTFKITSTIPKNEYFQIKTNKGIKSIKHNDEIVSVIDHKKTNTAKLYSLQTKDSLLASITIVDSLNQNLDTTLILKINNKIDSTSIPSPSYQKNRINGKSMLTLTFPHPILKVLRDSITYLTLTDTIPKYDTTLITNWNENKTQLTISSTLFKKDTITLNFGAHSFTDIFNRTSTNNSYQFKPYNPEDYGTIKGNIITKNKKYKLQLIDNKGVIYFEQDSPKTYDIYNIKPGLYAIRILIDEDNDGKFQRGNFQKRIPPETIYIHPSPLNIKANWEFLDIDIKF